MIKIFGLRLISEAHSDIVGILFGILVSILIILISTG